MSTDAAAARVMVWARRRTVVDAVAGITAGDYRLPVQLAGDDLPLDLAGALVDPRRPNLPVQVLDRVPALEPRSPVDLHRRVDDELRRLGSNQLRHRRQ